MVNVVKSSYDVWLLLLAFAETKRRSCGVYLYELSIDLLCVHESGIPINGHASMGFKLYLYESLPLYGMPYKNVRMMMPSKGISYEVEGRIAHYGRVCVSLMFLYVKARRMCKRSVE